jgi:class 3 adenylate cyclase
MPLIQRHYRIRGLNFRDFWDICSHYHKLAPRYRQIRYSVDGYGKANCQDEPDVGKVLQAISGHESHVRRYVARYYVSPLSEPGDYGNTKIFYLPEAYDFAEAGLHFVSENDDKLLLYKMEEYLYDSYQLMESVDTEIEYGLPCEVLCTVIDMRGFSTFCEQPTIESPYACGLMTAFYGMVRSGFNRYPPDLVKFLGDGVLAVWQTNSKDRAIAMEVCLHGLSLLPRTWRQIATSEEFTLGAPEGIGSGLSFGLASKISIGNDYIGRPINIASRLCSMAPSSRIYIARNVPLPEESGAQPGSIHVKSFGEQKIWLLELD